MTVQTLERKGTSESLTIEQAKATGVSEIANTEIAKVYTGGNGGKDANRGGKGQCWTRYRIGHIAAWCQEGGIQNLYVIDEDESEAIEETPDHDEDLQAWEQSEHWQWQEVVSRRD